ncbi:MAG TPA: YvcK family protein [Thermoclostridium sp.]|nr:YvcK family protein [Clostridiaceae bacterium]HOQ76530.1 YvcK family protein [Thermoclostridium sp.]
MKTLRWFLIGFRFKRYLIIGLAGLILILSSILVLLKDVNVGQIQLSVAIFLGVLGVYLVLVCLQRLIVKLINIYPNGMPRKPKNVKDIGDVLYRRKILSSGPKVVVIGGGTGISTMLRGLKHYTSNITAIITVADDGGGSGQLRCDLGMLPPGDIRNCMVALAETEPVLEKLMNYRFPEGRLKGQSFGNLFLAAMCGISDNNFVQAVTNMGQVLAITGRVYPVTDENVNLVAELKDGTVIEGESRIGSHHQFHPGPIDRVRFDKESVRPIKEIIDAIGKADIIVMGPGSLYTSIIPNLLVEQVPQAISRAKAIRVYVCNVMTQPGETENYTVADHIEAVHKHAGCHLIDCCLVNNGPIEPSLLERYRQDGAAPVELDLPRTRKLGVKVIEKDLVGIHNGYVRHDPEKLAVAIMDIFKDR